jgi:hypothetical protein
VIRHSPIQGGPLLDGHGIEGKISRDQLLTDPDQAVDFVRATKVDALATLVVLWREISRCAFSDFCNTIQS